MGRAIGLKSANFSGVRIAGKHDPSAPKHMIWVPAHVNQAGTFVSQRVSFSGYLNSNRGKKDATGKVQADLFNFVAWGKLADAVARSGSVGRALDLKCEPTSYLKPITDANNNPVMAQNGTQLQINTCAFRLEGLVFGEEARDLVLNEIAQGLRPAGWDNPQDQQATAIWRQICANNNAQVPNYQSQIFGHARIIMPTGTVVDPETRQPIAVGAPAAAPAAAMPGVMHNVGTVMPAAPVMTPAAPAAPVVNAPAIPAGYVQDAAGNVVPAATMTAPAPAAAPVMTPAPGTVMQPAASVPVGV